MPGVLLCFRNPNDIQMILDVLQFALVIKPTICFAAGTAGIYLSSVELVLTDVCYLVKLGCGMADTVRWRTRRIRHL